MRESEGISKIPDPPEGSKGKDCGYGTRAPPAASSRDAKLWNPNVRQELCDRHLAGLRHRSMRALGCTCSTLRLTVMHPCSCIELLAWHGCRLLAAWSARRYDDSPRARGHSTHHAAISGHDAAQYSDVECTGAPCDLAGAAECSAAVKRWQKREWTFAGFSAHTYRLFSVSRCVLYAAGSCRLSQCTAVRCLVRCCGSWWFFVGGFPQCLRHNLLTI